MLFRSYKDTRIPHKYLCYLHNRQGIGARVNVVKYTIDCSARAKRITYINQRLHGISFAGLVLVVQDTTIRTAEQTITCTFTVYPSFFFFFRILGFPIPSYLISCPSLSSISTLPCSFQRLQPLSGSPVLRRNIQELQLAVQLQ